MRPSSEEYRKAGICMKTKAEPRENCLLFGHKWIIRLRNFLLSGMSQWFSILRVHDETVLICSDLIHFSSLVVSYTRIVINERLRMIKYHGTVVAFSHP